MVQLVCSVISVEFDDVVMLVFEGDEIVNRWVVVLFDIVVQKLFIL